MSPDYSWQDAAVKKWAAKRDHRGIVEAVTGTGKTHVGLKALEYLRRESAKLEFHLHTVVIVPSRVLQDQWVLRLETTFPGLRIGRLGMGHRDGFHTCDVIVGVVNSVARHGRGLLAFINETSHKAFLIADECHRYLNGRCFRRALDLPFSYRLGLTPRMPPGENIDFEVPGLGPIVEELDMERARLLGLIPPFHLLDVPVRFSSVEQGRYDSLSVEVGQRVRGLRGLFAAIELAEPDCSVFTRLKQLYIDLDENDPRRREIEELYRLFFRRASICHLAASKLAAVVRSVRLLHEFGKKTLVFYERIASADETEEELSAAEALVLHDRLTDGNRRLWCRVFHSGQTHAERQAVLAEFSEPGPKVLIACRSLDEGFDLPEVDAAILAASTQSPRQRIQRIGRVLRKFSDQKRAIILTFYVPGTGDARVVANDKEMFPGPTDVFNCKAETWEATLLSLLQYYKRLEGG